MPVFTFSGKNAVRSEKVSGERTAANKQVLTSQLRRERITPGPIREKGKEFVMPTFGSGKVKTKDIAIFFRQFSVMIDAGLPLVQCLEILAANQENPAFQKTLDRRAHHGGRRRHAGQRHAAVSQDLRRPHHQHDRGRRNRRYSRHHSAAPGHLRRKGRQAAGRGQVGPDLPGVGCQLGLPDRRRAVEVGGADLRQPVHRTGRCPAAADPHRHGPERVCRPLLVVLHRRHRRPGFRRQADSQSIPEAATTSTGCC